ncbi:unnamed protein product [Arctogadus glacialis]
MWVKPTEFEQTVNTFPPPSPPTWSRGTLFFNLFQVIKGHHIYNKSYFPLGEHVRSRVDCSLSKQLRAGSSSLHLLPPAFKLSLLPSQPSFSTNIQPIPEHAKHMQQTRLACTRVPQDNDSQVDNLARSCIDRWRSFNARDRLTGLKGKETGNGAKECEIQEEEDGSGCKMGMTM